MAADLDGNGYTRGGPLAGAERQVRADLVPRLAGLPALQALLESRPYGRGQWRWEILQPALPAEYDWQMGLLGVRYEAEDAYHLGQRKWQRFTCTIPAEVNAAAARVEHWRVWLFSVIRFIEAHEAAEFYLPYGERVFDPHDRDRAACAARWFGSAEILRVVPDDDMLSQRGAAAGW